MNDNATRAKIQEPGIGGPVDLAGIERYGRIRFLPMFLVVVVMLAVIISSAEGWLDLPVEFPFHRWLPGSAMMVLVFLWAFHALSIPAGNKTETWLALLAALLAIGLGVAGTFGSAALLFFWKPAPPNGVVFMLPVLGGYVAVLALILPASILANRRYKRLVRAAGESGT